MFFKLNKFTEASERLFIRIVRVYWCYICTILLTSEICFTYNFNYQSTTEFSDMIIIINYFDDHSNFFLAGQRVRICPVLMHSDSLQYFATLFSLFYDCGCVAFLVYFFFYLLISLNEDFCCGQGKVFHSCHVLLSGWILEFELHNRGLFKDATCAHSSRISFTWLHQSVSAHPGWIFAQPIKPEHMLWIGWTQLINWSWMTEFYFRPTSPRWTNPSCCCGCCQKIKNRFIQREGSQLHLLLILLSFLFAVLLWNTNLTVDLPLTP